MPITSYFDRHSDLLDGAVGAIRNRTFWSPFSESPSKKIYGEKAPSDGENAFKAYLNGEFELHGHPGQDDSRSGGERSPYGFDLNISYPSATPADLIRAGQAALPQWRDAGVQIRTGLCLEMLVRLNRLSFLMAHAVMHTTGQSFVMAFQAGGPHAQDRGLEAVAYAYDAMQVIPERVRWEKPQGRNDPLVIDKFFRIVPRGIAAVIGVSTFPTWNGYPGLFASLVTGNPVIVKPHPAAILPLALTVRVARETLEEAGYDPNLLTLLLDDPDHPAAKELCTDPSVRVVDYTGGSAFGLWLEENCRQAQVYTEKSGINAIVIDDFSDIRGMARNLSYALSLYTGQMCTTPQNIYIPKDGIKTEEGHLSFDEVGQVLSNALGEFLSDPARALAVLGAVQSGETLSRIDKASASVKAILKTRFLDHPDYPDATIRTPVLLSVKAGEDKEHEGEIFGAVSCLIATESTADSLALLRKNVSEHGAITAALYTDSTEVIEATQDVCAETGVALSINLTGGLFVNQSAAFSDYHGTGANPAANAALCDAAFVANRFKVVETRIPVENPTR